jgi:PiT family inorganic phosphate transporter
MNTIEVGFWVVAGLVALAIAFDFMNGFHDAANSIATVVSTGRAEAATGDRLRRVLQRAGDLHLHLNVAATIGKGIVLPGVVDHHVVFGA